MAGYLLNLRRLEQKEGRRQRSPVAFGPQMQRLLVDVTFVASNYKSSNLRIASSSLLRQDASFAFVAAFAEK